MKKTTETCFVLEVLDKELNEQKIDYQFYYKCQKICKQFGMEQLKHAKAILELEKTHNDVMGQLGALMISWFSMISANLAIVFIGETKLDIIGKGIVVGTMWMVGLMIYSCTFVARVDSEGHAYYYSVICDEIERRNEKECQHK